MVLVDGYNAIRRIPQLRAVEAKQGLEAGRDALVARILESGIPGSQPVVIVFDGDTSSSSGSGSAGPHRNLTMRFAESADDAIVQALSRSRRRDGTTVVTADSDLAWRVKKLGAAVVLPEAWPALAPKRRVRRVVTASGSSSEKPRASKAEVDYWLKVFEDED